MQVQTGASLQNSPMRPEADAVLAHSCAAEQLSEYAEQVSLLHVYLPAC